ncbi:MAG: hypothetical protein ACTJGH_00275 [Peptoniphilaceae bacterium]
MPRGRDYDNIGIDINFYDDENEEIERKERYTSFLELIYKGTKLRMEQQIKEVKTEMRI